MQPLPRHILEKIKCSKKANQVWKENGKPVQGSVLYTAKNKAKAEVRRALRQNKASKRQSYYESIMENANNSNFHKLVDLQRKSTIASQGLSINGAYDDLAQLDILTNHYKQLATPPEYDINTYHDMVSNDVNKVRDIIAEMTCDSSDYFTEKEIRTAIGKLNNGKTADEYNIKSEIFKNAIDTFAPILLRLFNACIQQKCIPSNFKSGIIYSIPKKGKDSEQPENHRGITVTPTIVKILENVMKARYNSYLINSQSNLQFGFTQGISTGIASILINEAMVEAYDLKKPLYVCTLDARKAFDTVSHESLLRKIYLSGLDKGLISLIDCMYQDMSSRVKWRGKLGESFNVLQGTRQGGVISPDLYKIYINDLLERIELSEFGMYIGDICIAIPTVADDVSLLSTSCDDMKIMMTSANDYAIDEKYGLNANKTNIANLTNLQPHCTSWELGNEIISTSDSITHLGLKYSDIKTTSQNIVECKISLLHRTCYSLLGTGMHGSNGLNPETSFRIYKIYILPRFLYGLASTVLQAKQIDSLEKEHRGVLRKLQGLPKYTATCAIYLLLGALPLEGHYHLSQLSLLNSIIHGGNMKIINLCQRQIAMKDYTSNSWFINISKILEMYNLPTVSSLMDNNQTKPQMKKYFSQKVTQYWTNKLLADAQKKITLQYLALPPLDSKIIHPLWSTVANNTHDVRRAMIKAKIATNTILLQERLHKFSLSKSPICELCGIENEDTIHFLKRCPALYFAREKYIHNIKELVIDGSSIQTWQRIVEDDKLLIQLLIDCSNLDTFVDTKCDRREIERYSRYYCASLFYTRSKLQDSISKHNMKATRLNKSC